MSIKSPLDIDYQIKAIESLRQGIDAYDKRRGWRGPITNKFTNPNWENKIKNFDIDPTLKWKNGEIILLTNEDITVKLLNEKQIKINKTNLNWALKGKEINDVFKIGDFIFVKKEKNVWLLKQYPKVNGGIVVINPFTGEVKALVGGYSYVNSEFNRVTQAKRQPGSAFKPFVYAAAMENGSSPNSIVLDAPFIAEQGIGLKDWKPENYGKKFYGPSTLEKELNILEIL